MTTLRKRAKTMQNINNLNEKCGDVRYCIQVDKRVYALHCLHCSQVCLQWDTFINHMEQEHGEDLNLDKVLQPEDDEMEIQIENEDKSKKSTLIEDELNDSDHSAFDDLLESEDSSNPLCLQNTLKIENVDCSPHLTMFDYINTSEQTHIEVDKNKSEMNSQIEKMTRCGSNSTINFESKLDDILKKLDRLEALASTIDVVLRKQVELGNKVDHCLKKQNESAKILGKHNILFRQNLANLPVAHSRFPIKSDEDLKIVEDELMGENRENLLTSMRRLLCEDLAKNLERIFDSDLLSQYNYDGTKGKKALKSYPYFITALKGLENNSCENCKQLSKKIDRLQESVNSLCKIVQQQQQSNLAAFAEIKVATTKLLRMETSIINYFPVTSTQGLQNLEEHIRDDNRELFASTMSILWRNCVGKNLDNILDPKIVMDFNIDGSHGKQRLKDYKNFYIALIDSIQRLPSLGQKDPEMTLRQAMQLCKKKQFRLSALNKNSEEEAN